ncbi:MAG: RNA methyltransferase [Bacteroidetes bacterium]|nr:RNA methyltransferase [Bacteroidota bacterium]MCW5896129.1 RNA methyltransferase [Bacteroidota bacterium]
MRRLTHDEISQQRVPLELIRQSPRLPIFAMLDNIRSLYNVGSIFRTSEGALVQKLFLSGYTPHPPRKEIEKTALGSTETVPWEHHRTAEACLTAIRQTGARICVLEHTTKSIPYYEVTKKEFPICLVVGNEITGVSQNVIAAADLAIEIPMFGMKQSLNAAVAYGIALFELVRIWNVSNQSGISPARVK